MARQFRAPRRARRWESIPGSGSATLLTGDATVLHPGVISATTPETVVRILGDGLLVMTANGIAAGDEAQVTLAIGVVSTDAATAGAGSLPDPQAEPEYPWLWWQSKTFFAVAAAVDGGDGSQVWRYRVDVKSQRILRPRQSLVLIAQYVNVGGNPEISWGQSPMRVLIFES